MRKDNDLLRECYKTLPEIKEEDKLPCGNELAGDATRLDLRIIVFLLIVGLIYTVVHYV